MVSGDSERLQQVMGNLLSNAIKFTPKGGSVQVTLGRAESHIEIAVADSGIGIDPAFLPQVFEPFQQAMDGTMRRHGGLGLGLSIVRHIVELHGGDIVADEPRARTGIALHDPAAAPEHERSRSAPAPAPSRRPPTASPTCRSDGSTTSGSSSSTTSRPRTKPCRPCSSPVAPRCMAAVLGRAGA